MSDEAAVATESGVVVAGYDGSRDSGISLDWAAAEAGRRGSRLRILTAWQRPAVPSSAGLAFAPKAPGRWEDLAVDFTGEARERAARVLPRESIDTSVVSDRAVVALVDASAHASLLVVGHRGRGALGSSLGSVSVSVAEHARCPVVVVRGAVETSPSGPRAVTVGVDGTPESGLALAFAADTAARWGVALRVLCAWAAVPELGWSYGSWEAVSMSEWTQWAEDMSGVAHTLGESAADEARASHPMLTVEVDAPELSAPAALEEASRTSSLLVVGSGGSGALGALILGSVSRSVLHHAACPVAVVKQTG